MKNYKTMAFLNSRYKYQFLNSLFTILIHAKFRILSSEFNFLNIPLIGSFSTFLDFKLKKSMKLVIELPGGTPQAVGTPIFGSIFVRLCELLTKKRQPRRYAENPRDTAVFEACDPQGHFF